MIYDTVCAGCHKADGQGGGVLLKKLGKKIPPIWGENSFNQKAGMSHLSTLASFIHLNMPHEQAYLSEEEALNVAAFVLKQPRS